MTTPFLVTALESVPGTNSFLNQNMGEWSMPSGVFFTLLLGCLAPEEDGEARLQLCIYSSVSVLQHDISFYWKESSSCCESMQWNYGDMGATIDGPEEAMEIVRVLSWAMAIHGVSLKGLLKVVPFSWLFCKSISAHGDKVKFYRPAFED